MGAAAPPAAPAAAAAAAAAAPQPVVGVVSEAACDPNIDYVSVAGLLADASAQLGVGEMVTSSGFSLFDAMSAVEIGNPKMDFGARPKSTSAPLSSRPPPLELSKAQLVSWMDRLSALEATWHVGGALAQTVYSSLHMMQLDRLSSNPAIAGFSHALDATCQVVNTLVLQGCVCEEEDFMVYAVGLPVEGPGQAADLVLAGLGAAAESYDTAPPKGAAGAAGADARLSAAVAARLAMRKHFYQALLRLRGRTKQDLDAAARHLARAAAELASVRASAGLGAVAEDAADAAWAELGFDPALNAHLAPPMPPRVCKVVSRDEAFNYYERLFDQLQRACRVSSVTDWCGLEAFVMAFSAADPTALARAALHFQVAQQPTFDQAAAVPNAPASPPQLPPGSQPWAPSPAMVIGAVACLTPNGPPLGDDADMFVEQALIAAGNWVQAVLLNAPRHRRRLRRGLEDWCHLYQHAINADCSEALMDALVAAGWNWVGTGQYPDPVGPLSCWVERTIARIVATHLMMGFQLELYEPRDYAMIYWYIDYLYGVVESDCQLLARSRPTAAAEATARAAAGTGRKGSAAGSGGKLPKGLGLSAKGAKRSSGASCSAEAAGVATASPAAVRVAFMGDQSQAAQAAALRLLCQGMTKMLVGLSAAGILVLQQLPFNGPAERYEQRFGSLHILTRPSLLLYPDFEAATDIKDASPDSVLQGASMTFAKASQMLKALGTVDRVTHAADEHSQECAALERVAAQNRLACMVAARAAASGTSLDVTFEFTQHKSFPVVLLKSRK